MRCGFYETEITPPLGTTIFGYYARRVNVGVSSKLYAKACVLEQDGKHCAMLVLDTLALPASFPDFIRQYVHDKTGIDPNAILIAATHAHTGFPTTDDLGVHKTPNVSENEPELHPELDKLSLEWIRLVSADAVVHAFRRLQEATVRFGTGVVDNISYVREYILDDGTVRTNPNYCKERIVKPCAEPDKALPLFFFEDAEGKPLGSIASFALHHDIISGTRISSDYSGVVARRMKEKFGMDFVSLFFAGFCGNINHANYMGEKRGEPFLKTYVETGNLLFAEILRILSEHAAKQDAEVLCSHAICLLIQLLIQGQAAPRKKEASVPHFEKLAALRAEIYQHPEEDWSIQEICERLCISRPYFHRIYQAAFDVTCTQDVIDSRILRAKQLLETTEEPIADISALCGFETDVYFMRQFKRHVGMTPTVYRRMCRNTEASDPLPGRTLQL